MAAPASPTATTIATDGLKDAGYLSPTSAKITQAETWHENVKSDIYRLEKKLKSLNTVGVLVLDTAKWRYALPTAHWSDLSLLLIHGSTTGTASAGSASSITLPSGSSVTTGQEILITANTGNGSISQVTDFTSQVATVEPDFTTAPDATSTFMVIDNYRELDKVNLRMLHQQSNPTTKGKPIEWYPVSDNDNGELIVRPVPDQIYGLKYRYYQDLIELDLTSTLMATLYQRWRNLFQQNVLWRSKRINQDTEWRVEKAEYERILFETIIEETADTGEDEISMSPDLQQSVND